MEQALRAALAERKTHEDQSREGHGGTDGKVPVTTTNGDVVVRGHRIGKAISLKSVVGHVDDGGKAPVAVEMQGLSSFGG